MLVQSGLSSVKITCNKLIVFNVISNVINNSNKLKLKINLYEQSIIFL